MYSFESRIRYSETDDQGRVTFSSILDYFQDCSFMQSEDLNVGIAFLRQKQVAWVLTSWEIEVLHYPSVGDSIRVATWPYDFKGFYGWRNFLMTDAAGTTLAQAASLWVLLDLRAGRPARILPEMAEAYQMEPPLPMKCNARKLKVPPQSEQRTPFAVQRFHLDTNHHVNNGKYILMAQEYLPQDFTPRRMRAEYRKSAVYGETIYPSVSELADQIVVLLADEAGKPYVVAEFE